MAKTTVNKFKKAVEATPDVSGCYQVGLKALGKYSFKIIPSDQQLLNGSVDIDTCTAAKYPNASRWDYCLSYNDKVYFVEVHPANTSEVGAVIKKLQWLKSWLNSSAPEINKLKAPSPYYWVQSKSCHVSQNSPQARRMASAGLKPVPKLILS